jgi:5-oxoprolinase (ATP-hydrolysing)
MKKYWQIWIDRGGTFTDIIAISPKGQLTATKLLSHSPNHYKDAVSFGIQALTQGSEESLQIKMGTTIATNALLERKGETCALAITKGFSDLLKIAYQDRPDLFALNIIKPKQLYSHVIEIDERILDDGTVDKKPDTNKARKQLEDLYQTGIKSLAVVLLHSHNYPQHELLIKDLADDIGFEQVSISHEISNLIKIVCRGDTTVVDAYLSPILKRYIKSISPLANKQLYFMQSHGGLVREKSFRGKDSILSGPAGGIVGAIKTCQAIGINKVISFDMGGTSTDVAHFSGHYERTHNTILDGIRITAPMLDIHTIAAGGGSVIHYSQGRYQVGPQSAGAHPGPACYRNQGPLTITDCNVLLGRILPAHFPKTFGEDNNLAIDDEDIVKQFLILEKEINDGRNSYQVAAGFIDIAAQNMANAIKKISTQKGHDVNQYTLCCFGGAAGQHACLVADKLGINKIMAHPLSGVLSALGIGLADVSVIEEKSVNLALTTQSLKSINETIKHLRSRSISNLKNQGISDESIIDYDIKLTLRYLGTDSGINISYEAIEMMMKNFHQKHNESYGFNFKDKEITISQVQLEANVKSDADFSYTKDNNVNDKSHEEIKIWSKNKFHQATLHHRNNLTENECIKGPAMIIDDNATIIVENYWQGSIDKSGNLLLNKCQENIKIKEKQTAVDPIKLEIFNSLFMSIAEQMGVALARSAYSINIKERLDFSCAVFDKDGQLIANAPHMPVHLGSMGESVRAIMQTRKNTFKDGDVFMLNDPYAGGTHLPDITVVTPMFVAGDKAPAFFLASRGHHADIGGITPGSMPPNSQHIEEEGVLITDFHLVKNNKFLLDEVASLLTDNNYPVRNLEQNLADLKAQIAANKKGIHELKAMIEQFGLATVAAYTKHIQDNAELAVREVISKLKNGNFTYAMDNGCKIQLSVTIDNKNKSATVDFTGTSKQKNNNFNAPKAVCRAAVLYVFRTLVKENIPLNEGCLKPITIIIPDDCLLNPRYPAAVVAGNVETSQVIVDALYGAMGVMAGAQGTMNNFVFGNEKYQYYETICGGSGAGNGFDGCSAVQTHMTNSRITDPEILEQRFPVVVEQFSIRQDSGGQGKWNGGNGVVRKIRFLEPMLATILSNRRTIAPFGLEGGISGALGHNYVICQNGDKVTLKASDSHQMNTGDVFVVETPGGGGFGVKG